MCLLNKNPYEWERRFMTKIILQNEKDARVCTQTQTKSKTDSYD